MPGPEEIAQSFEGVEQQYVVVGFVRGDSVALLKLEAPRDRVGRVAKDEILGGVGHGVVGGLERTLEAAALPFGREAEVVALASDVLAAIDQPDAADVTDEADDAAFSVKGELGGDTGGAVSVPPVEMIGGRDREGKPADAVVESDAEELENLVAEFSGEVGAIKPAAGDAEFGEGVAAFEGSDGADGVRGVLRHSSTVHNGRGHCNPRCPREFACYR